ncbi:unnamed protein product [Rotaria sp. Silwood2]|nr:unnamed protein product [Rotaria sp. Silwood2]
MGNDAIARDLKLYVETIVDIHAKFVKLLQEGYNSEKAFVAILDKLSQKFINNNAVTEAADSTQKSAELLARYSDAILQKSLLKSKLITCSEISHDKLNEDLNETNIKMNYHIQIADDFKRLFDINHVLMQEVRQQLSSRFKPKISAIEVNFYFDSN